jgi:hypothetical protein
MNQLLDALLRDPYSPVEDLVFCAWKALHEVVEDLTTTAERVLMGVGSRNNLFEAAEVQRWMAKAIAAFRQRYPPMELPTAIAHPAPPSQVFRSVGSVKTREATYKEAPWRERDQSIADFNESYLSFFCEVAMQIAEHEPEATDPRFRSPLATNYLDHLTRMSKDKIWSPELQSRVRELGWATTIHSRFQRLQLEPRSARPPVFPTTDGTGNAETVREECLKRLLQLARAELGGPEVQSITSLAYADANDAYQPVPKKDDTPSSFLKRAMISLDRPQLLHDAGLAALNRPEGQSSYMSRLMFHLERWVNPRDRTLLFAHLGTLDEFQGRAAPTVSNGGYTTYFQSTEDTASIRHAVMHIKIALAGQAQESTLNLPLNILEARMTSFGYNESRQLQGNMGTEAGGPALPADEPPTKTEPATTSMNELVKHYRDQSAAFTNLQREIQTMSGQLKLQTEVQNEGRRRQIKQGQHMLSAQRGFGPMQPTYPTRAPNTGAPRQLKSPESFPPNLFSEMPAWVVEGMTKAGHAAGDSNDPKSSYMTKGGPCAACGNAHGTAYCPHVYIVGSRFKSSRPADEIVAFQSRRGTYITFPSNLQALMCEEVEEDNTRGDALMASDSENDEDRAEAYLVMGDGADQ